MAKNQKVNSIYSKRYSRLWWVGLWATVWWALSGIYLLGLVWLAKDYYTAANSSVLSPVGWWRATLLAAENHTYMDQLFCVLLIGWMIGAILWFRALRSAKVRYKYGLKDLLFNIR